MPNIADLKSELLSLQAELADIQSQGRILTDCWIAKAKPGSKKHKYLRLKSRQPIFNGKKTEYIQAAALAEAEAAIARGRAVKKLTKRIGSLSEQISQLQHQANSKTRTGKKAEERYTPPEIIALVRLVMGEIDLDPASDDIAQQWIQATNYYTSAQDGLSNPWFGRVWLHPPGKMTKWTNKLISEYESEQINEAILLVTSSAGSKWFQKLTRFPVCFLNERIFFLNHEGIPQSKPKQGNTIFYLGQNIERFKQVFAAIGSISSPS